MNFEQARFNMIEQQIRPWGVLDSTTLATIHAIPREHFVPPNWQKMAFADVQIPLKYGECMMHPKIEAHMLQALNIQPTDLCLEIGTGTGFITACIARLGREVDSIEIHEEFTTEATKRLRLLDIKNANLSVSNLLQDWRTHHTPEYDVIAVTASMPEYLPDLAEHLVIGGRLFVIVGDTNPMHALLITRESQYHFEHKTLFETMLKSLNGIEQETHFEF